MCSSSYSSSSPSHDETLTLIPGLPYDISSLILTLIPYCHHTRLRATCKTWRFFFSSKNLLSRRRVQLPNSSLSHLLCIFPQDPSLSTPYLFDPRHLAWCPIPPMPCNPHVYGLSNFISVSIGPHIYVIGGSLFDTRSFPIDRPSPSSSIFRFDVSSSSWDRLSPMLSPRGSFACAAIPNSDQIVVAGGGSRHTMFGAAGSRMSSVERYDVEKDEWVPLDGLPRFRAGCVGFMVGSGEDREFWVMGGYGDSRTISGVFPVDEYYKDGVVLELKKDGKWREIGDMWEEGERGRLGNVVVVDGKEGKVPGVFMLDGTDIFRYDISSNRWQKESCVPRKAAPGSSYGFVALNGELHVMATSVDSVETRMSRQQKKTNTLFVQIYHPKRRTWRFMTTKPPLQCSLSFKTAVMCTIRL